MPVKRLPATIHICTRTRGNNIERGIGVEYTEYIRGNKHSSHLFHSISSKNAKDYLRAFETAEEMEELNPENLAVCIHAGKKGASVADSCCQSLKKYQPSQLEKIFVKRAMVFGKPCDETVLVAIIAGFHAHGVPIDDPFAKAPEKEESAGWGIFPHMIGIGMKSLPLSI